MYVYVIDSYEIFLKAAKRQWLVTWVPKPQDQVLPTFV